MSLKEPIVEGAYYEREDGCVAGPFRRVQSWEGSSVYGDWTDGRDQYLPDGAHYADPKRRLTRRVHLVPTDPAEVVAELRVCQKRAALIAADSDNDPFRLGRESAWGNAADIVAKKLGVK